ncbi:helix-turn-helix domain-containing protein [Streptomyces erythrochromogenes]|uniref:helix-turn-helix domain-containing protein n=1 Tax=Streptomyces erythrochromogenes TaxID=285574 RepID=UPI0037D80EE4
MNRDPEAWKRLGRRLRNERELRGMSRKEFASVAGVSEKAVYNAERGDVPGRHRPPSLVKIAAGHGWAPDSIEAVLAGKDPLPATATRQAVPPPAVDPRSQLLESLPGIYAFGRLCVSLGGAQEARDDFEGAVQRLLDTVPTLTQSNVTLAAYRPHALGEGIPADDADAILRAMEGRDGH